MLGVALGHLAPRLAHHAEALIWPMLAGLLFTTFTQTPLREIPRAWADRRFLGAAITGNFVLLPVLAFALTRVFDDGGPVQIGLLLVLLVPCTDWFLTFTHLGRGDTARAAALTPLNLVLQLVLLPLYLWLMTDLGALFVEGASWLAAAAVVIIPLIAAVLVEPLLREPVDGPRRRDRLAGWPVPLLGLVIVAVTASQAQEVIAAAGALPLVVVVSAVFLVLAVGVAMLLGALWALPVPVRRTLAFSFATRNSFIVLPLALALPLGWEIAAVVVVAQSLVELLGMILMLRLIPGLVFPQG